MLTGARLGLFAWSWRRPLMLGGLALVTIPLMFAALVIQVQHTSAGLIRMPVAHARLTQPFGCTSLALEPASVECPSHHFHSGVDLAAPLDTPIYAATDGRVIVQRERGGYGLYILILRDPRLSTLYAHLDLPLVQAGDVVAAGQPIALMGSSGNSTGPHLHFEIRIAGVPVDPLPLLGWKGGGR